MRRSLQAAFLGVLALCLDCNFNPDFEGAYCGIDGTCPSGFCCDSVRGTCVRAQRDSCLEEPATETADEADGGPDDGGPTDSWDDGDLQDRSENQGEDDLGPADQDPCRGHCLPTQYCDETDGSCKPCESFEHCGSACSACSAAKGESCNNMGGGEFCCASPCSSAQACQLLLCSSNRYICNATSFAPLEYAWSRYEPEALVRCSLSDSPDPLPETVCADDQYLVYHCPWDGVCASGYCALPNPPPERKHDCGQAFGCQKDRCRLFKKDGQKCQFNYDCESFCCSRGDLASSTCLSYNEGFCKIFSTRFLIWVTDYTWIAKGSSTLRNVNEWVAIKGNTASPCVSDSECDSGVCGSLLLPDHCVFHSCLDPGSAGNDLDGYLRSAYFCPHNGETLAQHDQHAKNQLPAPTTADCAF